MIVLKDANYIDTEREVPLPSFSHCAVANSNLLTLKLPLNAVMNSLLEATVLECERNKQASFPV
jgi:hypothetical protein